ncbi:transposase [Lacihabitans sp. LS3-19]|uniref:transposase n=1 Tax=Lacihabitans sp. LS3-19 TaxID=2487335 RepID=UPI0020CCE7EE|nr:transposase [Lacihabitans sp. LS3-19]MCP9766372.1 transposase [Lacihabitans sp. LS3-19]
MPLFPNSIYHIYNQGNNKERIFIETADYQRFTEKLRFWLKPNCDLLAFCLMPNHFHILIQTNEKSLESIKIGSLNLTLLSNGIRLLLSEYAQEFNKKYKRTGSLFRQKTKYKLVDNGDPKYIKQVFKYVLANPLEAKMVSNLKNWTHSSFLDQLNENEGGVCDLKISKEVFQYTNTDLEDIANGYDDILYLKDF